LLNSITSRSDLDAEQHRWWPNTSAGESQAQGPGGSAEAGAQMSSGEGRLRREMLEQFVRAQSVESVSGSAFAIAGVTCGLGGALSRWGIVPLIEQLILDAEPLSRQRALQLLLAVAMVHGRLAEAHVVYLFKILPAALADPHRGVRDSASACADVVASTLSGSGARIVLPQLLESLQNAPAWRTRAAAAIAIGKLVRNSPRQLSGLMSRIINALAASVREAHTEVSQAARESLALCAKLSRCREITGVLPALIAALEAKPGAARTALESLCATETGKDLDAVALGLVLPPLHECSCDASPVSRRQATAVAGALLICSSSLSSPQSAADVVSQRVELLQLILKSLGDTDSSVRVIAADAVSHFIGVNAVGNGAPAPHQGSREPEHVLGIQQWLFEALGPESKPSLRAGAALTIARLVDTSSDATAAALLARVARRETNESSSGKGKGHDTEGRMTCMWEICRLVPANRLLDHLPAFVSRVVDASASHLETQREAAATAADSVAVILSNIAFELLTNDAAHGGEGADGRGDEGKRRALDASMDAIDRGFVYASQRARGGWRLRLMCLRLLNKILATYAALFTTAPAHIQRRAGSCPETGGFGGGTLEKLPLSGPRATRLLAEIFFCRHDPTGELQEEATKVFRLAADHPPRATRMILPELLPLVVTSYRLAVVPAAEAGGVGVRGSWQVNERLRGELCMEYLAQRFAGFDGANALKHLLPPLISTASTGAHSRDAIGAEEAVGAGGEEWCTQAASLDALKALADASSCAQLEAYTPAVS